MKRYGVFVFSLLLMVFSIYFSSIALANTSTSENYQVTDMDFGVGIMNSCSGEYCTEATIGSMVAGSSESSQQTAQFEDIPAESEPFLEVIVTPGESNLGVLRTDQPATKTTKVQVRNHLSEGYMVQMVGDPPKYGDHTLNTPTTPTESTPGIEQFAVNVVANSTPQIGANPVQVPSGEFSFGFVEPGYDEADKFKYKSGDVIARSNSESGQTDYTISMIVNVSGQTPAGHYASDFSVVVIPIF